MAASNKDPFRTSARANGLPHTFTGLVQAGSTQAIKIGEICAYNKTSGYWVPVSAVADSMYALAISKQEQKSTDVARYIEFYSLHPEDVFEFVLDAARTLALGDTFTLTASDSQKLTYSATAHPVARCVVGDHYPETGTTIRSQSYANVQFDKKCSAWGLLISKEGLGLDRYIASTSALTLLAEQSGLIIGNTGATGATIHTLPQSCPAGTKFTAYAAVAQDNGFDPGAAGGIYIEGAKNTDNYYVTVDGIGDSLTVIADGNGDWIGIANITSAADQTGAIDVQT